VNLDESVILQAAVIRKGDPSSLEHGPDVSSAIISPVCWNFEQPINETDTSVRNWMRGIRPGDQIAIMLRSEPASFDISLISELRLHSNIMASQFLTSQPQ
jgi:hypothetical protein